MNTHGEETRNQGCDPACTRGARSWLVLGGFMALLGAIAAIGGVVTAPSVHSWYQTLVHPSFTPPDWVFAPAWTTLYVMIAVAGWLVWRKVGFFAARPAFTLYGVQLALNLAWSVLFFGLHLIAAAMVDVLLLEAAILLTIRAFGRICAPAGYLLVPYVVWVAFASVLNAGFLVLNP